MKGRKGAKRAKIGVIGTLKMAENGPKFQYFSLEKGVQVPQLMFLGQTYLVLISWNKIYQLCYIWGILWATIWQKSPKLGENGLKSAKNEFQMGFFRRKIAMKQANYTF